MPTDEAAEELTLVRDLKRGADQAFQLVLDIHGPRLLRLARTMLGNSADAEDALQQTLVGLMQSIGTFRGDSSLKTWLTRILVNQASKIRRSRSTREAVSLASPAVEFVDASPVGSTASAVAARVDVETMLAELSPEHRDILVLRELEGLSYKEIAEALGIAQGTVESRLFRARDQMRRRFEGYRP